MTVLDQFSKINTFIFDIDGVLTDGNLHLAITGELLRTMNIKDGYALQLAVKKNYNVWVISGGKSEPAKLRLEKLGVKEVYLAIEDKSQILNSLLKKYNVNPENALYMGDDMPDLVPMKLVGLSACPADACDEVINASHYISPKNGGKGCVREVIEKVMKINNHWE